MGIETAILGSAVIGGVGSMMGADKEADAAQSQMDQAGRFQAQQQAFNQQQLDDWENMFGGMEENVTDYYNNLDPEKFATAGKQNLAQQMSKQMTQFNESMSAQGLQTSGMRVQAEKEAAFTQAAGNAGIDLAAPEQVNQMKQGYLNSKEHRRTNAIGGINSSYGGQVALANQNAQMHNQSQAGFMGAAGNMFGSALNLGMGMTGSSSQTSMPGGIAPAVGGY